MSPTKFALIILKELTMNNQGKYAAHQTSSGDWCVFNILDKTEVCLCHSYEGQA